MTLVVPGAAISHACFHPSLPLLATVDSDASVRFWDTERRAERKSHVLDKERIVRIAFEQSASPVLGTINDQGRFRRITHAFANVATPMPDAALAVGATTSASESPGPASQDMAPSSIVEAVRDAPQCSGPVRCIMRLELFYLAHPCIPHFHHSLLINRMVLALGRPPASRAIQMRTWRSAPSPEES